MNVWAPGRINLIGEHTDYSHGLVMPAAIELGLAIDVRRTADDIRLFSTSFGPAERCAADGSGPATAGWARFAQAVAVELHAVGRPAIGIEAKISSTLPAGVGLSSSAALEVGIAFALCAVADFDLDALELADVCRRAEQRAVGVPCGILDQAACVLGQANSAIMLDCRTLEHRLIPVPADAAFLILDSGVARQLENSGYAERRRQLETALARIPATNPRDVSAEGLEGLNSMLRRRLRHVITENERVQEFASALAVDDLDAAGRLISASHESLRREFEVSLPELDELARAAEEGGAYGARLLGGGFGGSVLALVDASRAEQVAGAIARRYPARRPPIVAHASDGARIK